MGDGGVAVGVGGGVLLVAKSVEHLLRVGHCLVGWLALGGAGTVSLGDLLLRLPNLRNRLRYWRHVGRGHPLSVLLT